MCESSAPSGSTALTAGESRGAVYPEQRRRSIISHMHFLYMIKNPYGDLYIGITDNPEQRLAYHNEKRGALFTKRDSKFRIVFLERYPTLAEARKREVQIKKWRREKKEMLIEQYKKGLRTKI